MDVCSLFLLQRGGVLGETRAWSQARPRLFLCLEAGCSLNAEEEAKLHAMLKELRILAQVQSVAWDRVHWQRQEVGEGGRAEGTQEDGRPLCPSHTAQLTEEYICAVNALIRRDSAPQPSVPFLYLPRPLADWRHDLAYLDLLSRDLGLTLLIHGITPVVTACF